MFSDISETVLEETDNESNVAEQDHLAAGESSLDRKYPMPDYCPGDPRLLTLWNPSVACFLFIAMHVLMFF